MENSFTDNPNYNYDPKAGHGLGIAGLVLGIISLLLSCLGPLVILLSAAGLIMAIIGLVKANRNFASKNLILIAIVISSIAFVADTLFTIWWIKKASQETFWNNFNSRSQNFDDYNDELDEIDKNFDSLKMNDDELDKLEKSMDEIHNGPGPAPKDK